MKLVLKCRPEQAQGIAEAFAEVAEARRRHEAIQEQANHFCAGVIAGLVPNGTGVLGADPETGRVTVLLPPTAAGVGAP